MRPATEVVEARGLIKDYATGLAAQKVRALHGVDFHIRRGEVVALLGPNGSGKSTLIKILLGLVRPTSGSCSVLGGKPGDIGVRARLGYVPDTPDFPGYLTARELVEFHGQLCGLSGEKLRQRAAAVLELVGLTAAASRPVAGYSRGMRQRAGLAQALVHEPEFLIMDEPLAGVDPHGAEEIVRIIDAIRRERRAVLITSHLIGPLETVCDRVAILAAGRKLCDEPVSRLTLGDGFAPNRSVLEQAYCRVLDEAGRKEVVEKS